MHIKLKLPDERLSWDMMMVYDKGSYTNKIVQVYLLFPLLFTKYTFYYTYHYQTLLLSETDTNVKVPIMY